MRYLAHLSSCDHTQAKPLLTQKSGPFVVVALQECARMNALLSEIRRTLQELDKGKNNKTSKYHVQSTSKTGVLSTPSLSAIHRSQRSIKHVPSHGRFIQGFHFE